MVLGRTLLSLEDSFPSLRGTGAAVFESVFWALVSPGSGQVRSVGPYLAHVGQPALLALVYEAVDDEARLAVHLEVGSIDSG